MTDNKRRPLRMLEHFNLQLWLALRGVAGTLPFAAQPEETPSEWSSSLKSDLEKFKRDRR